MERSSALLKLWRSRETVLSMVSDRGYTTEGLSLTKEEFMEWADDDSIESIKEALSMLFEKEGEKTYVSWCIDPKFGLKISNILLEMEEKKATRAITIVDVSVTPNTKSIIASCRVNKIYIDWFTLESVQFVLPKHEYVPRQEICSKEEKAAVKKSYGIKGKNSLPHMAFDDPVARYLGALKGDLIKIYRDSYTQPGQKSISYREVN